MQKKQALSQEGGEENTADPDIGERNASPGRKKFSQSLPGRIMKNVRQVSTSLMSGMLEEYPEGPVPGANDLPVEIFFFASHSAVPSISRRIARAMQARLYGLVIYWEIPSCLIFS